MENFRARYVTVFIQMIRLFPNVRSLKTLYANWGDTIEVTVTNNLANNGTGIHWVSRYHLLPCSRLLLICQSSTELDSMTRTQKTACLG
jgi:hypothetical protein